MSAIKEFIYSSSRDIDHIITAVTQSQIKCFIVVANEMIKRFFVNTCPAIAGQVLTLRDIDDLRNLNEPYNVIWHDSVVSLATKEILTTRSTNDFMDE